MNIDYIESYKVFKKEYVNNVKIGHLLGKIETLCANLSDLAVLPSTRNEFLRSNTAYGVYSTLAMEGVTLSLSEIEQIMKGDSIPEGKKKLQTEVENLLGIYKELWKEIVIDKKPFIVTPDFIKRLNNLSDQTGEKEAKRDKDNLLAQFSDWLRIEFTGSEKKPSAETIIEAIIAGMYFEWFSPFNANFSTARLLEYTLMVQGGIPNLVSHILPAYYYETRYEFNKQFEQAQKTQNITGFVEYALIGFKDGLVSILRNLQAHQLIITWQYYINSQLSSDEAGSKITERRKELMLAFPLTSDNGLTFEQILILNTSIARAYAKRAKTARRDIAALVQLGLLTKRGKKYYPNVVTLLGEMALKSSIVNMELIKGKDEKYSAHVLPSISALELKLELLQTLSALNS